jgi:hypothetical protein
MSFVANFAMLFFELLLNKFRGKMRGKLANTL